MAGDIQKFTFQLLGAKTFPSLELKECQEHLQKWGMENRLHAQTFSFDHQFKPYQANQFALDFLQSDDVMRSVQLTSLSGSICYGLGMKADAVDVEPVPCTAISMSMFDKLQKNEVVQEGGYIRKCFEEYIENVCLADQLRNVLVNEEHDKYCIYNEDERDEFLFRLFTHLCIGGGICQYEDIVTPYISHTKQLYKDLICVQKEAGSSDLHIISHVFKVKAKDAEDEIFFPDDKDHLNSFAYLIIDPLKRHVTLLHHKYAGGVW